MTVYAVSRVTGLSANTIAQGFAELPARKANPQALRT
jgi:hypothetical protein